LGVSKRQYVTTAIDYPNAAFHMGHVLRAGPIAFRLGKRDGVAEALDRMPIDIRAGHGIVGLGGSGEAEHEQQGGDQYDQVAEAVKRTIV
jgi:hypothetical protein